MELQTVASDLRVRVGDVEREACVEMLTESYVRGRLSTEELDRRRHQALEAVTSADLAGLVVDLPVVDPLRAPVSMRSATGGFWPASGRDCAVKLGTMLGGPATFVTGGGCWWPGTPMVRLIRASSPGRSRSASPATQLTGSSRSSNADLTLTRVQLSAVPVSVPLTA